MRGTFADIPDMLAALSLRRARNPYPMFGLRLPVLDAYVVQRADEVTPGVFYGWAPPELHPLHYTLFLSCARKFRDRASAEAVCVPGDRVLTFAEAEAATSPRVAASRR